MSTTLYLEGNFLPDFTLRPNLFYLKLAKATTEALLISDVVSEDLKQWLFSQQPQRKLTYLSTEEAVSYLKNPENLNQLSKMQLFIEDRDGSIPKEIYRQALNAYPTQAYVLARWIDWVSSSKSTLTVSFSSLSVTKSVINQTSELYQFVELFPESEEAVLNLQKELHRVPMGAYYLFNKGNPKLQPFSIYDSNQGQMLTEIPDHKELEVPLDMKDLFLTLERIEKLLIASEGDEANTSSSRDVKEILALKALIQQYLRFEYGLEEGNELVPHESNVPIKSWQELIDDSKGSEEREEKSSENTQTPPSIVVEQTDPSSPQNEAPPSLLSLQNLWKNEGRSQDNEGLFGKEEEN